MRCGGGHTVYAPRMDDRTFRSAEAAAAHVKIDGLIRLMAIVATFLLWALAAVIALSFLRASGLLQLVQAVALAGLTPAGLAVLTWRGVEKLFSAFLYSYAKKHFRVQ